MIAIAVDRISHSAKFENQYINFIIEKISNAVEWDLNPSGKKGSP